MADTNNQSFDGTQSKPFGDAQSSQPGQQPGGNAPAGDSLQDRLNTVNPAQSASQPQPPQDLPGATPTQTPIRTMDSDTQPSFTPPGVDESEPMFTPETMNAMEAPLEPDISGSKSHALWWILGVVAGVIILGLIGYFVVYPILSGSDVSDSPVAEQPVEQPAQQEPVRQHTSAFVSNPAGRVTVSVGEAPADAAISAALRREVEAAPNGLTEIVFTDNAGNQVRFNEFLVADAPSLGPADAVGALFADDFTAFIYKDSNGAWPGYVATLDSTDTQALTAWFEKLEASQVSELFVTSPGELGSWRNGTVLGLPDRYAPGETAGASLGYLAHENRVLISTSFEGMKQAIHLLGWASE